MNQNRTIAKLRNLKSLLAEEIRELYDAESRLLEVFPRICGACSSEELADALAEHFEETRTHRDRLEEISLILRIDPRGRTCSGMVGLVEEIAGFTKAEGDRTVRDLGIIAATQRAELYELSAYGSAKALALRLGLDHVHDVLAGTEDEEAGADRNLTRIAEGLYRAASPATG